MKGLLVALALVAVAVLPGCAKSIAFCEAMDDARLAIADVPPEQYPQAAAEQVAPLRDAAADLSGEEASLADRIVDELEAASKTKPGSLAFGDHYNAFVANSNEFTHRYCTEPNTP